MRGKGDLLHVVQVAIRITPAHAGKRASGCRFASACWDHPRTCGEKNFWRYSLGVQCWITPAHAGKSRLLFFLLLRRWDHPRTCGEKRKNGWQKAKRKGSPPHMRGKGGVRLAGLHHLRITPAHAGKRLKRSRSTVPHAAIVPLFPSVCNKPAGSDGSPAGHDAPPFLPIENAAPASPAYNLRSL